MVTNLDSKTAGAQVLYEALYCARGDMENRIKEQQLGLFADRTSTATLRVNPLRLYLSSFTYLLMHGLRRLGLAGTRWARAQCSALRARILKLAAGSGWRLPPAIRTRPASPPCSDNCETAPCPTRPAVPQGRTCPLTNTAVPP